MVLLERKTFRTIGMIHSGNKWTSTMRVSTKDGYDTIVDYGKTKDASIFALMERLVRLTRNAYIRK